jgi:multiple sugar transport system permease protein
MKVAAASIADIAEPTARKSSLAYRLDISGRALTLLSIACAVVWAFPLYWLVVTTFKPEFEVVRPYVELWPDTFTFEAYVHIIKNTKIVRWYINSIITSTAITVLVVFMSAACGYAISQLRFPGRSLLWGLILASFMVPIHALIVNHFVIMSDVSLLNTLPGVILPQLIHPVVVIVYKQFFDSVPRDFREAAIMDGANHFHLLFRIYLPMNWGVTVALAIITFITAWNAFLWPFLVTTTEDVMTVAVGITQVQDAFGIYYARLLAGAVLTGLPVALIYLIFQRRVTQAITLSAGIKG